MNTDLRQLLYAEAVELAERHPADLDRSVALGQQRLRSRLSLVSVLTAVLVLAAAATLVVVRLLGAGEGPGPATVVGVAVTAPGHALELGTRVQATATAALSDGGSRVLGGGVVWASADPAVVAVDGAGLVTAVGPGTAEVTAAFGGHSGSAAFAVAGGPTPSPTPLPHIVALRVDPDSLTVEAGTTGTINAHFIYSDGSSAAPAHAEWWSSDPTVATVAAQPNGGATETAIAAGTAKITALARDEAGTAFTATATVTVNPPAVVRITIYPPELPILYAGDKPVKLTATVVYRDGTSGESDLVAWASTDNGIAHVDSRGYVYPEGHGTATITAALGDVTSPPVTVTVKQIY
ncbi:Ig-like domain-containing protein [Sinomonas mesophila]|uniref:Ig-like domain-containing protein n=1 Tax=Sinomonas mesophila TaxID=1531955 RepID=UPI0011159CCC|nr:Ig-like domain-containing protein [Sinomonas mesophila]